MKYVKSPINYIGNKYRLLKNLIPLFPKDIDTFVDIFSGSGTVLINVNANKYIYNDINYFVSDIFSGLVTTDYNNIVEKIESIISEYSLNKENKEGFNKLREDYNNGRNDWFVLYTLMCFSFNHQFRFNSDMKYNSSFGSIRAYFSERQKEDLRKMKDRLNGKNIEVQSKNFINFAFDTFDKKDFFYFDPPYLGSVGNYNDGRRGFDTWSEKYEKDLLDLLDKLNENGLRFALSNNLKYKNDLLNNWKNKYNVYSLQDKHLYSGYNKKDRTVEEEILITNY